MTKWESRTEDLGFFPKNEVAFLAFLAFSLLKPMQNGFLYAGWPWILRAAERECASSGWGAPAHAGGLFEDVMRPEAPPGCILNIVGEPSMSGLSYVKSATQS